MKRTVFLLTFISLVFISSLSMAAGPVARLSVQNAALIACTGPLIEGTISVAAYDSDGTLINDVTPVASIITATHSNGPVAPIGWDFRAGQANHFAFSIGSATVTSLSIKVSVAGNADIATPIVTIRCDGTVTIGSQTVLDARLNTYHCDLTAALYSTSLGIEVWEIKPDSTGLFAGAYTQGDIAEFADGPPSVNTIVAAIWPTTLEVLTTGELQIKIAPDAEGKSCAVILDEIPPAIVYFR